MRKEPTSAEQVLWDCLRNRQLLGAKFRRQHNLGRFIADFYCHEARLILEADGESHLQPQPGKVDDAIRDQWARAHGFTVLRFKNEEILDNLEAVLHSIAAALPPRPQGEGAGGIGVKVGCQVLEKKRSRELP